MNITIHIEVPCVNKPDSFNPIQMSPYKHISNFEGHIEAHHKYKPNILYIYCWAYHKHKTNITGRIKHLVCGKRIFWVLELLLN